MNTHAFYFHLMGNGQWVMEAEAILPGEVSEEQAREFYNEDSGVNLAAQRVFLIPTASEPGYQCLH